MVLNGEGGVSGGDLMVGDGAMVIWCGLTKLFGFVFPLNFLNISFS